MKAKDYADRWIKSGKSNEELVSIGFDLIIEIKTIATNRKVSSDSGLVSVIREVDQKWQAFAGMFPEEIDKQGFRRILEKYIPDTILLAGQIWPVKKPVSNHPPRLC